ncbi:hypothetical protein PUT24_00460, partial [Streptomyces sp. SP17KL33]|nr:hypothetical protein [Streptomyces sp. SP17KL33]
QLLVPRLAAWCAVWLEDEGLGWRGGAGSFGPAPRLARVWHGSETRIEAQRRALEQNPPRLPDPLRSRAVPVPWPEPADENGPPGPDGCGPTECGGGASAGQGGGGSAGQGGGGSAGSGEG